MKIENASNIEQKDEKNSNLNENKIILPAIKRNRVIPLKKGFKTERVKKMGGIIFGGRVFGNLMLTRAFGDNEFKQYGVICNPHITKNEIDIDDKYIVLASDGVWDVMNENEIFELSKECKNSKEFCDMIVKNSLIKGSMDNISCFVIRLN